VFFRSRSSLGGGLLTGLTNRVGDVLLLALIGLQASSSSGTSFATVIILILVSFTKSAQVPFSGWLPAAMLAPTPVSALVHSSTLVTAGVYLLFRFCPFASWFVVRVGLFTSLLAGAAAFVECDLKKIIALSTLSHLGLIMLSLGLGEKSLCFAHLNTHAGFKALLFIGVGTTIHSGYGSQEARSITTLSFSSPLVLGAMVISMLSISGFTFLSGWVSKEAILGACVNSYSGLLLLVFFYLMLAITLAYSLRLTQIFLDTGRLSQLCSTSVSSPWTCKAPLLALVLRAVLQGECCWSAFLSSPSLALVADKVLAFIVIVASVLLFLYVGQPSLSIASPFAYLSLSSGFPSLFSSCAGTVVATEVSAMHGAGIGKWPSLVLLSGAGGFKCNKGLVFLYLVVLLA